MTEPVEHPEELADAGRGVRLCWQAFGDPADPPLLLVAGLGTQLVSWPVDLCRRLASAGLYVVRYDNRDAGRSTRFPEIPPPSTARLLARRFVPDQYTLDDMAQDAAGLLGALDLAPAHVVGVSMGGMIGQMLAARHPESVRSLVSIMSTTGARRVGRPHPSTLRRMVAKPATDRDAAVARSVAMFRHIGSRGFPVDEQYIAEIAGLSYDRGFNPAGTGRQLAAIIKSGDRTAALRSIVAPTLVVHGDRDLMVDPSGARATVAAIPGARLETIAGMGHDLPAGALPRVAELVLEQVAAVDGRGRAAA